MEEGKSNTLDVMVCLILSVVLILPMLFMQVAVFLKLWQWFAESRTGITFTVFELAGLWTLFTFVWTLFTFVKPRVVDTKKGSMTEKVIAEMWATTITCLVALLCGWVIHSLGR